VPKRLAGDYSPPVHTSPVWSIPGGFVLVPASWAVFADTPVGGIVCLLAKRSDRLGSECSRPRPIPMRSDPKRMLCESFSREFDLHSACDRSAKYCRPPVETGVSAEPRQTSASRKSREEQNRPSPASLSKTLVLLPRTADT